MADQPDTTPTPDLAPDTPRSATRRLALLRSAGALVTAYAATLPRSAAAVTIPRAAGASPDAELIRLCDQLVANNTEWFALMNSRHTIEDEKRTEPENERLHAVRAALLNQIEAAPDISTMAGAAAMARAAIAITPVDLAGQWEAREDNEWLALTVAEFVGREGVA